MRGSFSLRFLFAIAIIVCASDATSFKVWAPHAADARLLLLAGAESGVNVSVAMHRCGAAQAHWCCEAAQARPGTRYVFQFNEASVVRVDARGQQLCPQPLLCSVLPNRSFSWGGGDPFEPRDPRLAVVYELHVASFTAQGTLGAAADKLQYLAALGVSHVELMPVAAYGGPAGGWGYNPVAPYAVMESLGGPLQLKHFVRQANRVGIAVVLDVVWNHMQPANALSRYDGYAGPSGNGIYFYESAAAAETDWGPRPAYDNPQVVQYILESVKMWIEEYHISGFRFDSTVCMRKPGTSCWTNPNNLNEGWKLLQQANDLIHSSVPHGWTTAEDDQGDANITAATRLNGAGFDTQWGYRSFFYAFYTNLVLADNSDVDMQQVAKLMTSSSEGPRVLFTENHDMASNQNKGRIPGVVDPGGSPFHPTLWAVKKSMLGIGVIAMGAQGVPMILQGQEFLTYATFEFPNPPKLDWRLAEANAGLVREVSDLFQIRSSSVFLSSQVSVLQVQGKVAVVHRATKASADDLLVIVNMCGTDQEAFRLQQVPKDGVYRVLFNGDNRAYSSLFGGYGMAQKQITVTNGEANVMIPNYSLIILQLVA